MCAYTERPHISIDEPKITTSILATLPDVLRSILENSIIDSQKKRKSILISSNSLTNRFILKRWGIRPSQRRRHRNLFSSVRKQSRIIFNHYLTRERIEWKNKSKQYIFGIYKFDEIRGNLILCFVALSYDEEWTLSQKHSTMNQ